MQHATAQRVGWYTAAPPPPPRPAVRSRRRLGDQGCGRRGRLCGPGFPRQGSGMQCVRWMFGRGAVANTRKGWMRRGVAVAAWPNDWPRREPCVAFALEHPSRHHDARPGPMRSEAARSRGGGLYRVAGCFRPAVAPAPGVAGLRARCQGRPGRGEPLPTRSVSRRRCVVVDLEHPGRHLDASPGPMRSEAARIRGLYRGSSAGARLHTLVRRLSRAYTL
jgi:hypothetical protein